jgi:hypothetical protein
MSAKALTSRRAMERRNRKNKMSMPTNRDQCRSDTQPGRAAEEKAALHPAWLALIRLCEKLQFGELEKIRIQNGLPMTAEVVREKVRFGSE